MTVAVAWFLKRTRAGLILRAVGENDHSAHSIGYSVIGVRYAAVAFGGAMAGLAGCYYSMVQTPMWAEELTAGRGWIALALVVFAAWRPWRLLLGAYLFGAVMTFELQAKAAGISIVAPEFLAALPYLATILVLALISMRQLGRRRGAGLPRPAVQTDCLKPTGRLNDMTLITRRSLLGAAGAAAALPLLGGRAFAQDPLKVGFVYRRPDRRLRLDLCPRAGPPAGDRRVRRRDRDDRSSRTSPRGRTASG